jgi:putative addiction module killer protein
METRYIIEHYITETVANLFANWFDALRDTTAKARIAVRIDRVKPGNLGDHKLLEDGVWELRIDYGPGYRVYYCFDAQIIILLLCGGDKRTQNADIVKAKACKADYERGKQHDKNS